MQPKEIYKSNEAYKITIENLWPSICLISFSFSAQRSEDGACTKVSYVRLVGSFHFMPALSDLSGHRSLARNISETTFLQAGQVDTFVTELNVRFYRRSIFFVTSLDNVISQNLGADSDLFFENSKS